jgi:methylmalonyl-CoA/ethylmalonyl-CoA epimerase
MPATENKMITGVDHIVIATEDLKQAITRLGLTYGTPVSDRGEPTGAGSKKVSFRFSEGYVEVVAPTSEVGLVVRRIAQSGEGVYVLAPRVDELEKAVRELRVRGESLVGDPEPRNSTWGRSSSMYRLRAVCSRREIEQLGKDTKSQTQRG